MNNSNSNTSYAVIGGGLVGRLVAWRLLQQGQAVTLLEQSPFDAPASAAHTAAAMISPLSEVVVSERAIFDMGMASLELWPRWLAELHTHTQVRVPYLAKGSLVVAHPADHSELEQFYQELDHHLGADNPAHWLSAAQLRQAEPDLSEQFTDALLLPNEAFLDNRALLAQLLKVVEQLGGRCIDRCHVQLKPSLQCSNKAIDLSEFDCLIDCRGLGANEANKNLRGVRGEVLWIETAEVNIKRPIRLMHPRYKLYLVPKPGNKYIIGATEIESQDRSPVSVQSMLELCSALYTLNPAFAEARIQELDANLRPAYWDNMPRIETESIEVSGRERELISINGLYRHGYLLAPYLVNKLMSETLSLTSNNSALAMTS